VIDKAAMLADFADFNEYGVQLAAATELALRAEAERDFRPTLPHGLTVGLSSGTSGQRGVFLVGRRERALWAGTLLARTLEARSLLRLVNPLARRLRIALFLRANSNLYATVHSFRVDFRFFDLLLPLPDLLAGLAAHEPDLLVAPASVLRLIAGAQLGRTLRISPQQVISVAEVLERDDSDLIFRAWGRRPGQIYQCTEGLLGQTCSAGSMHLNEEFVHFEPEWLDESHRRFMPLITDFTRSTQVYARYRLDDVVQVDPEPCPCGRVTLRLTAIEGRRDDILWLRSTVGSNLQPVFPDVLRQAIALHVVGVSDYRVRQRGETWEVSLQARDESDARQVFMRSVALLCSRCNWQLPRVIFSSWNEAPLSVKRRRIACEEAPAEPEQGTSQVQTCAF